jgi:hypothetical protein
LILVSVIHGTHSLWPTSTTTNNYVNIAIVLGYM